MRKKMFVKVASVLISTLVLLQNANGQSCICKCGPTGLFGLDDLCSAPAPTTGPLVVRPKALVKPNIKLPLFGNSSKGPCFRKQAIVKPAIVPRPVYLQSDVQVINTNNNNAGSNYNNCGSQLNTNTNFIQKTYNCESQDISNSNTNVIQKTTNSASGGIDISKAYEQACTGTKPTAPADAVSLAIAFKHSQENYGKKISEDRLTYGFRKLPIEMKRPKPKVYKNILPEKNLYEMNGQVVELKAVGKEQTSCDDLAEEAQEELLDLVNSEEASDIPRNKRPSLDELGYAPAQIGSTSFVNIPSITINSPAPAPVSAPQVFCNDGFKTGTVEYKTEAKIEPIVKIPTSLIDDTSCESQEEAVRHINIPSPTCSCNYNGNTAGWVHSQHRYSKSSSSSANHQKSHVTFEKLCH